MAFQAVTFRYECPRCGESRDYTPGLITLVTGTPDTCRSCGHVGLEEVDRVP